MAKAELLFKALADTTRRRLLRVLSTNELSVSELVAVLDQPQSTVSRHLKVLREAGLVVDHRVGGRIRYAAQPPNPEPDESEPDATRTGGQNGRTQVLRLRDRLLGWVALEDLDAVLSQRLAAVLKQRHKESEFFFDVVGSRWDQLRLEAFGNAFHLEALTGLLPAEWTVADIGTGTGYLLEVLAERFRKVIAIDPAEPMLEIARNRPELRSCETIEFRAGSIEKLPLADGEVDLAIASLVLHHVETPAEALIEVRRGLSKGGRLLVIEQAPHEHAAFHECMGDRWSGFEPEVLADWTRQAGLADVTVGWLRSPQTAGVKLEAPALFVLTACNGKA